MRLIVPPGVFRPISDSWMLADAFAQHARPGAQLLELCTGSGAIAVTAARRGADVTAVDVSRRAVLAARVNARLNGAHLAARRGDLYGPVTGRRFDVIASNPPYVPSEDEDLPRRGSSRAWDAGHSGRVLLDRIIAGAPAHLAPGGVLLLVHSDLIGEERTLEQLEKAGLESRVLARRRGPLGPLMRARRAHLERQGMLGPGQDSEQLLIIEGRAPVRKTAAGVESRPPVLQSRP
jgi:release factor glutamine methyltransferase